ncbi:MAG: class I SAM-dependent methyltransferase [Bryobacteraceae bacterium]
MRLALLPLLALPAFAAEHIPTPYASIRGVLQQLAPPELKSANAQAFAKWSREKDKAIRARLEQGDLDSMVNLLLFGTSFTSQPRMTVDNLGAESRAGLLRARLDDMLKALNNSGANERLVFLRSLLTRKGHPPATAATGAYILENLQRVLKEKVAINERIDAAKGSANVFSDRGVSLDTTIPPNYGIDAALEDLKARKLLPRVTRVAIVGPGLDFIDKESGFDYYPQQTLQPFAVFDSLKRLGLGTPNITILDISPRVLDHIQATRSRTSYTIQLPRSATVQWPAAAIDYWRNFGSAAAQPVEPIPTPANLPNVVTRAVRFPVPNLDAVDLNIVSQQLALRTTGKFDLVVATNILVYYNPFEQALALSNIAAMLKPGGFFLTNDQLPDVASIPMRLIDHTSVVYSEQPRTTDSVFWYQRR